MIKLQHGDCLELMKDIPDKSIDMILCDLPYGLTHCNWDIPLDMDSMWNQYKRIIKDHGAILLFSIQPFTTDLIQSNRKMFRYEIVWKKTQPSGFLNAKRMPLRNHEIIAVFYRHPMQLIPISKGEPKLNSHCLIQTKEDGNHLLLAEYTDDGWTLIDYPGIRTFTVAAWCYSPEPIRR